jgi:conjugal transfer pilus assembly protein TraW
MKKLLISLFILCNSASVMAQSLGVHGTMWLIQEEDAVTYVKRRISEMDKDGSIKKMQTEASEKIQYSIIHRDPVPGYSVAKKSATRYFDPTISLEKSIVDLHGRIIYPAGTKVNPLVYGKISNRLIFIDAREEKQVKFAQSEKLKHPKDDIVLVAGDWVSVSKKINTQAYYDQDSSLTNRLKLNKTPSIVSQDGLMMKIEEIAL